MPCEMHVGTEHHSITVCLKNEQTGTSETVLTFYVQKKILQGQKVCNLRKSFVNRKHTESTMYMLIVWENFDTELF